MQNERFERCFVNKMAKIKIFACKMQLILCQETMLIKFFFVSLHLIKKRRLKNRTN